MRKFLTVLLIVFFSCICFSQELLIPVPGDYVYYKRDNNLLGILYINPDLFRIRLVNGNNENTVIDVNHTDLRNGFQIRNIKMQYGSLNSEEQKVFIDDFQFLLSTRANIDESNFVDKPSLEYLSKTDNESYQFYYEYWIPCIQLKRVLNSKNEKIYELIKIGKIKSQDDDSFYTYTGDNYDIKNIDRKLTISEIIEKQQNGCSFSVNRNWNKVKDSKGSDMYILSEYTGQDAVLLIEKVDLASIDIQDPLFFIKYYLVLANPLILPESIEITKNEYVSYVFETYNQNTKYITRNMCKIFKNADGTFTVVSLSMYKDLYETNESYFNTIWSSIKK